MTESAKPFLKWVGGKRQLADRIVGLLPRKFGTYFEPFVGGGAVFFTLAGQGKLHGAVLNDFNIELMNVYKVVRDYPDELIEQVSQFEISKDTFMSLRGKKPSEFSPVRRAARTLFLNKTGFNGLYRVNKSGLFNVPWGRYANPTILDPENIRKCSEVLSGVRLLNTDFAEAVKKAVAEDVVYFDPPYVEVSKTANFTGYTSKGFTMDDQKRLAETFAALAKKGVAVLASNADVPPVRELYKGWEMHEVQARRAINSNPKKRGPVGELIIVGRRA